MTFEDLVGKYHEDLIKYWETNKLKPEDFYCRECGKLMLDRDDLNGVYYNPFSSRNQYKWHGYVESEKNRWLVKGRELSGKVFFRHLCWECFFKHLPEIENISKRALKSSWYKDIKSGNLRPPATWSSPSKYFKLIFDISDNELETEHKKFDTASLESFIRRHGEKIGKKKYDEYKKRQAYTCSKEYMIKEKGMTEKEWHNFNASRAVTLENLVSKHGEEIGTRMWNEYCERQSYAGCKLEYFIEKYGIDEGKKKYEEVNKTKEINLANFIRKYGKEDGTKRWLKFIDNKKKNYSKISSNLFRAIDRKDVFSRENSKHGSKVGGEATIVISDGDSTLVYHPDFIIGKKIIEFYGDYFHANPIKYSDDMMIRDKTAKEVREQNDIRKNNLEQAGYTVKVVWEHDYIHNKKCIINECLEFIHS